MHQRIVRFAGWVLVAVGWAFMGARGLHAAPPDMQALTNSVKPVPLPDLDQAVRTLLDQPYLGAIERAEKRVRHGQATLEDLQDVTLAARNALARARWNDPSLKDEKADITDRAEALLRRGEPDKAFALVDEQPSLRASRIAIEALLDMGRSAEALERADRAGEALVALARTNDVGAASELAEGVRCLVLRARLAGAEAKPQWGYQPLLTVLAHARDGLDGLDPSVHLAEAMLLYEKDEFGQAAAALEHALTRNPTLAEAWFILGRIHIDTFDFDSARAVAARLDEISAPAVSAHAGLLRAGAHIRQVEGALAQRDLEGVLAMYPTQRDALAQRCAAAAVSFDTDRTEQLIREFGELSPNSARALIAAGKALAGARQYDEAASFLSRAAQAAPMWAEPSIELGLSEMQSGRLDRARAALTQGLALDRFNTRARNNMKLLEHIEEYATLESEHFIVRYQPGPDELLARDMLEPLEAIYARVTGSGPGGINHRPEKKTVLELYPNHRWFATRISGMPQLHTFAAATGPVIAMEAPRTGPGHKVGPYDWPRVVQHEYTHTVTLSRTKNRLPHWFTEASAMFLEDAPKDWNTVRLLSGALEADALFDFETINVMFVRPRRATDRSQAYAQGAWMYEYIVTTFGADAPLKLMDLYATGVREEQAFSQVLGVDRETFLDRFKVWARGEAQRWGMVEEPNEPPLEDLLAAAGLPPVTNNPDAKGPTREQLRDFAAKHVDNPFALSLLSDHLATLEPGAITDADAALLETYTRVRPVDPTPHKLLSARAISTGTPERAIPHLEWLDAREQSSPTLAIELARLYAAQSDWPRAIAKATRATRIAPYDATLRERAAAIALRAGDIPLARRHIHALTVLEPERELHKERLQAVEKMLGTPQ